YGAEVYIDDKKIGTHEGPMAAFEFDVTPFVWWGKSQKLTVKAYNRRHYMKNNTCLIPVGWDLPGGADSLSWNEAKRWFEWAGESKFAYGITKYVKLLVLPTVYVSDLQVITSVSGHEFIGKLKVTNLSEKDKTINLSGKFSSWNKINFDYPPINPVQLIIPKGKTVETIVKVPWNLGEKSYWWPNIPFSENYQACLHYLELTLSDEGKIIQKFSQRFGFVEYGEGQSFYTVNGIRVTGISDGTAEAQMSGYDVYSLSPAFLPSTKPGTGCPETWKRYMRIGFNTNRLHCSTPTQYMIDAADETGFMLIPEAPIWGNRTHLFNGERTTLAIGEIVRFCRNHPSVARYSLTNEVRDPVDETFPWRACIDAAFETDSTRPFVFEMGPPTGRVDGLKHGHAYIMEHYQDFNQDVWGEIRGMGEHFWQTDGMVPFAVGAMTLRMNNWSYFAPWSWMNYWPNFLEGMSWEDHAWKVNRHADRRDFFNGWRSPVVEFVQKALNPFLILDEDILKNNQTPVDGYHVTKGWKEKATFQPDSVQVIWPVNLPTVEPFEEVHRTLRIFNGDLKDDKVILHWEARWDSPEGPVALKGESIPLIIQPGFNAPHSLKFQVPGNADSECRLYLILESYKNNELKFRETAVYFNVLKR
ncbi:MAG: hypothetical protein JW731_15310, partial [Bacteroidales bacterium]|nr:hypothetical protein [Bacteroidales bacterium]